jgi:hypothetical protein
MKLSVLALAVAVAIAWAAAVVFVAAVNLARPPYGEAFLQVVASVYPGYHFARTGTGVLIAGGYALLDGLICGTVVALLYNACARSRKAA